MTVTQTKPEFLTEALIEVCNNEWKVLSLENGRSVYTQLEMEVGRKYIKVWSYLVSGGERLNGVLAGCSLIRILANVTNLLVTKHLQKVSVI